MTKAYTKDTFRFYLTVLLEAVMPSILTSCEIKSGTHLTLVTEKLLLWRAMEAVTMDVFTYFSLLLLFWVAQQKLQWRAV
jgi:hypothetical protein